MIYSQRFKYLYIRCVDQIKTYHEVVPENTSITFDIKRMEDIYDKVQGLADEPHRHEYYIVLIVLKAKGSRSVDFQKFELKNHQMYFVSPGQVHQIVEEEKSYGYAITFSPQFLIHNFIEESFLKDVHLFQENGFSPPLQLTEEGIAQAAKYGEEMLKLNETESKWKYQSLGAWLKLLLIHAQEACDIFPEKHTQTIHAGKTLLREFKSLLEKHYASWHKVSSYADALHITADYLNNSISNLTGKNVKSHIQNRILLAAKRMLLFSEFNTKEIAYELGFKEPANFSTFFKKHTKMSPSAFKKAHTSK